MAIKFPKSLIFVLILIIFLSAIFLLAPFFSGIKFLKVPVTAAQSVGCPTSNLSGYAWSSNIGWVSLSGNAQDGSSYGVYMNPSGGPLCGYAWSSDIGWVDFNVSNDCILFPENPKQPAYLDLVSNTIQGWAEAVTGMNGTTCGGPSIGGWDGWIKMSGTASTTNREPYGVSLGQIDPVTQTGQLSGYAWGGDVIGWIDFSQVTFGGSGGGFIVDPLKLSVTLAADPNYTDASLLSSVNLTANVSGNATGQVTYKFYCNVSDPTEIASYTGNETSKSVLAQCDYSQGYHTARVVVIRGSYTNFATATISVGVPLYCGVDPSVCPPGQECDPTSGYCRPSCIPPQVLVNGSCINPCGPGNSCPSGQECVVGGCVPVCPAGQIRAADGTCVTSCDSSLSCPANQECVNGGCIPVCPAGQTRNAQGICSGSGSEDGYDYTEIKKVVDEILKTDDVKTDDNAFKYNPITQPPICNTLNLRILWNSIPSLNKETTFTGSSNSSIGVNKWIWIFKSNVIDPISASATNHTTTVKFTSAGTGAGNKSAVILGVKTNTDVVCYAARTFFVGGRTEQ